MPNISRPLAGLPVCAMLLLLGAGCNQSSDGAASRGQGRWEPGGAASSPPASAPAGTPTSGPAGTGGSSASNPGALGSGGAPPSTVAGLGGAGGTSGDRVVPVGTNPFVATAHDALSTFGADVDTASYDLFRRDVNLGGLPQPASVRLEDYVNYFSYDYPAPAANGTTPFQISLAAAKNVFDRRTTLLRVGIQAITPPPAGKRPVNVVFLMDVSGSMQSPDKLPLAQRIATNALNVLDPSDTVSIVTYASGTQVRLAPTPVAQRAAIVAAIAGLVAGGSTAGGAGLNLAYEQAAKGYVDGGINHVVLCTDGDFNVGPSSTAELLALIRAKRATGVTLTALGFGVGNLNDAMMESVSNAGNGMYAMISNADQADNYAQNRLLSTLVHVAKDMKIQVEFNPAHVAAYRLLGYENRDIADTNFRNDVIDGGEVGAGHRVTALYELVLAGEQLPLKAGQPAIQDGPPNDVVREVGASDMVLVKVRWKPLDATDATPAVEVNASLAPEGCADSLGTADADLRWTAAVAAFAEILKRSPFADATFLPEIDATVAAQATRDGDRAEFNMLYTLARPRLPRP